MWVIAGQALAGIGSVWSVRYLAHQMTPESYGELNLALSAAMVLHMAVSGPLNQAATRYFAQAREQQALSAYFRSLGWLAILQTAVIACATPFVSLAGHFTGVRVSAAFLASWMVFAICYGLITVADGVQAGARARAVGAWHQIMTQWTRPLLAGLFFRWFSSSSEAALEGFGLASVLTVGSEVCLLYYCFFLGRGEVHSDGTGRSADFDFKSALLRYAWPFASYGLLAGVHFASDRWLLDLWSGAESVAAYSVSYQLGYQPFQLIASAAGSFIAPILFQIAGDGRDGTRIRRAIQLNHYHVLAILVLTALGVEAAQLCHGQIFLWFAPRYQSESWHLPFLLLAGGAFSAGQALTLNFLLAGDSRAMLAPKVLSLVVGLVLNAVLVKRFATTGAVAATVLFNFFYCAFMTFQFYVWRWERQNRMLTSDLAVSR